jgi:hypothetical protein
MEEIDGFSLIYRCKFCGCDTHTPLEHQENCVLFLRDRVKKLEDKIKKIECKSIKFVEEDFYKFACRTAESLGVDILPDVYKEHRE